MTGPNAAGVAPVADGCAPPVGGVPVTAVRDLGRQAVLQGVVRRDAASGAQAVAGAYVRLLDGAGEFTAEVVTDEAGGFRFYAAPGEWTLRTLAPRSTPVDVVATAVAGAIAEVDVTLAA